MIEPADVPVPGREVGLDAFYALDRALDAWDHAQVSRGEVTPGQWSLDQFLSTVLTEWDPIVIVRQDAHLGILLSFDGCLMPMPMSWVGPLDQSPADDPTSSSPDTKAAVGAYFEGADRSLAFDDALTSSVIAREPIEALEGLLNPWKAYQEFATEWPSGSGDDRETGEPVTLGLGVRLAAEAIILSVSDPGDVAALRMMLALNGVPQQVGYDRIL